jgi:hypothetical protein
MATGGELYPEGLGESGGWASEAFVYYPERVVRVMANPYLKTPS